jgi:hypothetical protein
MQAALDGLDGDRSSAATVMREQYAAARKVAADHRAPQAATKYDELRLRAIAASPARAWRDWRRSLSPHPGRARLVRARRRAGRKFSISGELT